METIYLVCALGGGAILVLQTLLMILGLGGGDDADVDVHDHDIDVTGDEASSMFFKMLSLKALVAFATFFGLSGLACLQAEFGAGISLSVSIAAGLGAMAIVSYLMHLLSGLQSSGNVQLEDAVGKSASVYLKIPGKRGGHGKVTVSVGGRKLECKAVTEGDEIATGREVWVTGCPSSDTLEVAPMEEV